MMSIVDHLRAGGVACHTRSMLRDARHRYGISETTSVHHVIPRACAAHRLLRLVEFDVDTSAGNFVLMPTFRTAYFNVREGRLMHTGGHVRYNEFVWCCMDDILNAETSARPCPVHVRRQYRIHAFTNLLLLLHAELRTSEPSIPWN